MNHMIDLYKELNVKFDELNKKANYLKSIWMCGAEANEITSSGYMVYQIDRWVSL